MALLLRGSDNRFELWWETQTNVGMPTGPEHKRLAMKAWQERQRLDAELCRELPLGSSMHYCAEAIEDQP
jgi:hypothetical protein